MDADNKKWCRRHLIACVNNIIGFVTITIMIRHTYCWSDKTCFLNGIRIFVNMRLTSMHKLICRILPILIIASSVQSRIWIKRFQLIKTKSMHVNVMHATIRFDLLRFFNVIRSRRSGIIWISKNRVRNLAPPFANMLHPTHAPPHPYLKGWIQF